MMLPAFQMHASNSSANLVLCTTHTAKYFFFASVAFILVFASAGAHTTRFKSSNHCRRRHGAIFNASTNLINSTELQAWQKSSMRWKRSCFIQHMLPPFVTYYYYIT